MVPEVQDQGRIDAPGFATPKEVKTEEKLLQRPSNSVLVAMKKPKLIGLTGTARSGKDTVAGMFNDIANDQMEVLHRISFAEPIRDALRGMMGLTDEHFHGNLKEVPLGWIDKSPRQLMQTLGTQWGRGLVDDQIWIKLAMRNVRQFLALGIHVVVSDVRFENEAKMIRDMDGVIIHVRRPDAQAVTSHASEAGIALAPTDFVIHNTSTLQSLYKQAQFLWEGV